MPEEPEHIDNEEQSELDFDDPDQDEESVEELEEDPAYSPDDDQLKRLKGG